MKKELLLSVAIAGLMSGTAMAHEHEHGKNVKAAKKKMEKEGCKGKHGCGGKNGCKGHKKAKKKSEKGSCGSEGCGAHGCGSKEKKAE